MNGRKISEEKFSDTGYSYTLSLISGKYKPIVLYCLMEYEPVRFNEMRRYLGNAADKTLSHVPNPFFSLFFVFSFFPFSRPPGCPDSTFPDRRGCPDGAFRAVVSRPAFSAIIPPLQAFFVPFLVQVLTLTPYITSAIIALAF